MHARRFPSLLVVLGALFAISLCAPVSEAGALRYIEIAGIKPGMSPDQVRHILGSPNTTTTWFLDDGRAVQREWHYQWRLTVAFSLGPDGRARQVARVRTYSPRDRLPNGIHVGVHEVVLHRKLDRPVCGPYMGSGGAPFPSGYECTWFPSEANEPCGPNLYFYMRHRLGRVVYIELSKDSFEGCAP